MSKNLLHRSKIAKFKHYLDDNGIQHRDGRGDYQVIQIFHGGNWLVVYDRNKGDHFTVDKRLEGLVGKFINCSRKDEEITTDIEDKDIAVNNDDLKPETIKIDGKEYALVI